MFWFFKLEACGVLAPLPGMKSTPPALEGKVLTIGPPKVLTIGPPLEVPPLWLLEETSVLPDVAKRRIFVQIPANREKRRRYGGRGSRTGCLGVCVQGSMKVHERVSRQDKVHWGEKGQVAADLLGFFQSLWEWSERQAMVKAFWTLEPGLSVFALIWIYFTSLISLYLCIIKSIGEGKWPPSDKHKNLKSRVRDLHSHINIQCVCLLAIVLLGTVLC